jgi:hypothetical protein
MTSLLSRVDRSDTVRRGFMGPRSRRLVDAGGSGLEVLALEMGEKEQMSARIPNMGRVGRLETERSRLI